jgi:hypothetical protein
MLKVLRGANGDTDHYLLIAGLRGRTVGMTDRRSTKTGPEVKQEYVNKSATRVEEWDKNNINWQTTPNNYRNCR